MTIDLITKWKLECEEKSREHDRYANYLKIKYKVFGILQLIIPITFTLANELITDPGVGSTVASVGFALSGVTTVVLNFLSFNVLSTKHDQASNSYQTIVNDIDSVLSSNKSEELLIVKIKNEIKNLGKYSPSLDPTCCSDKHFTV